MSSIKFVSEITLLPYNLYTLIKSERHRDIIIEGSVKVCFLEFFLCLIDQLQINFKEYIIIIIFFFYLYAGYLQLNTWSKPCF